VLRTDAQEPEPGRLTRAWRAAGGADRLRWALAGLWILDAGLQLQPAMFTRAFAGNVVYNGALMYQPAGLENVLFRAASLEAGHLVALSLLIATVQLAIGAGLLLPSTIRPALLASAIWATLVWVFGQGLGFMVTGTALIEFGAPGSALLYLALTWLAWPRPGPAPAARALGRLEAWLWSGYWALGAGLHLPLRFPAGAVLAYNLQTAAQLQPGWLQGIDYQLARYADAHGLGISVLLAAIELILAAAVWRPRLRRPALALGLLLTALFWVLGQAMGGLFTGLATDLSSGPLVALLGLSLWPAGPLPNPQGRRLGRSANAKKDPAMTYSPTPSPGQYHRR